MPNQASGTRQRRRFVSEFNSSFRRAFLAFVSYLHLIPTDHNFVLQIHLAKHTIQGLSVLDWLTERRNSEIGSLARDVEPGLGKVKCPAKVKWLVGEKGWTRAKVARVLATTQTHFFFISNRNICSKITPHPPRREILEVISKRV